MAALAWLFYDRFRRYMSDSTANQGITLSDGNLYLALFRGSTNASLQTLTVFSELTREVSGAQYVAGGKSLAAQTWTTGASVSVIRMDADNPIWTASGTTISVIKYAVIYHSTGATTTQKRLVCRSQLTATPFNLNDGNTLTITFSANGIFELS